MREILVYADVACPFTHAGLRKVVAERADRGLDDEVVFVVRAWPLELVNGRPLDPQHVADEIEAMRATVAADLFTGFDTRRFPGTSLPALALTSAAYAESPSLGERTALRLRTALFEEGLDVSRPDVLATIGRELAVEVPTGHDAALAEYEAGQALAVVGSPYFMVGESGFFCPALDVSHDEAGFRVAFSADRFATFCDALFG